MARTCIVKAPSDVGLQTACQRTQVRADSGGLRSAGDQVRPASVLHSTPLIPHLLMRFYLREGEIFPSHFYINPLKIRRFLNLPIPHGMRGNFQSFVRPLTEGFQFSPFVGDFKF